MKNDVRYLVLSDLHLGQDQSILTRLDGDKIDPSARSLVLDRLMDCLEAILEKNEGAPPSLILLGDAIELALTEDHVSLPTFERFCERWVKDGVPLFREVIYVPGNHDHHIWHGVREQVYRRKLLALGKDDPFPKRRHTTPPGEGLAGAGTLVQLLMERALGDAAHTLPLSYRYPDIALLSPDGSHLALLSHGHFFEAIYLLMSAFTDAAFPASNVPPNVESMEADNFAWIDFFWSAMGRQGQSGAEVERIYDILAFPEAMEKLIDNLVEALLARWDGNAIEKGVAKKGVEQVVRWAIEAAAENDRQTPEVSLAEGSKKRAIAYIEGPLRQRLFQAADEVERAPTNMTFVFGHTHKPFEALWSLSSFSESIRVYNTGGWAIDPAEAPQPLHGGACVLLNESLESASLRFFAEPSPDEEPSVKVRHAGLKTEFSEHIASLVDPTQEPFKGFTEAATEATRKRLLLVKRVVAGENTGNA